IVAIQFQADSHDHDRRRPRLQRDSISAQDRLSHARRAAEEGARNPRPLAEAQPLPTAAGSRAWAREIHPPRRPALRQRQHPHRPRAQQDPQGRGDAQPADARLRFQLRAGLGLPRLADRVEGRGGVPRAGQEQGRGAGHRIPPRVPRLRCALGRGAGRGIRAARRRGRLGPPLHHHDFSRRGADRARDHEVRAERHALSRLQAGDGVGGGAAALAEAEIEYEDYVSDQVWVKFPIKEPVWGEQGRRLDPTKPMPVMRKVIPEDACVVIWTTTPWTIPGNRAISYSSAVASDPERGYGLYQVTDAPPGNWASIGDKLLLANRLANEVFSAARVTGKKKLEHIGPGLLHGLTCNHPLASFHPGYSFTVPLLEGDHVGDDVGTGFVHTAPGHGREDFDVWTDHSNVLADQGINTTIPYTVDEHGAFTEAAPGFAGKRVLTDTGEKGDANDAVIKALTDAGMLIA